MLSNDELDGLVQYMETRFGLEPAFLHQFSWEKSARDFWMMPKDLLQFSPQDSFIEKRGLRAFNGDKNPPKPTTVFIQRFGRMLNKNVIDLTTQQFQLILDKKLIPNLGREHDKGFVILKRHGFALGCGFVRGEDIESQIPVRMLHTISPKFL
ncbi:MAG: hypothetical protein COW01_13600 [Bdellovibrionales bacterium CG12_big_fil_rev_8_21_14_0_65_38_15]|nr:MAG: hypothetical protein COW79_16420 [Bdellovibrionales bacterium CG22_combo_CG10-13_8_21_14_all_38_13]PIQ53308.1 MAG: hypothetical protein COW01_13600 [Bdellovibrionales bacterium CG12_big_fil_rev_8_21_14_0_65_38_15]PIR30330.1 MAG: hypothetical protein COV38_06160 [Bdellovibrionales bacterium CG11_big_fil_rev_8_21_14_0_20_38_13]